MTQNEVTPLFCTKISSLEHLCGELSNDLDKFDFDRVNNSISPEETSRNPEVSLNLRLKILTKTYRDDYHTDSFDMERLKRQIQDGDEAIWFWGHEEDIKKTRELLKGGSNEQEALLGTVTVLSVEDEYGIGYGELCRSGSQTSYSASPAILDRTISYLCGEENWLQNRYHTLTLVSRNRPTTESVRGGEAIHRIHSRYVQSRFWGFAPWYVMQGGVLELLDHRHCNRNPNDVINALKDSDTWYFAESEHADFAESLCRLNFGISPRIVSLSIKENMPEIPATINLPPSVDLFPHNHGTVIAGRGNVPLQVALDELMSLDVCCAVVQIPINDRKFLPIQNYITKKGFYLTSILPPIKTWIKRNGQRTEVTTQPSSFWCRPRSDLQVIQPFYHKFQGKSCDEEIVLNYLRTYLSFQS